MHMIVLLLSACLVLGDSRRMQTVNVDDDGALDQNRNAYSLAQLVQTAVRKEDKIKQDFLSILRKDPDWKNMIDLVVLVDHKGSMLIGQQDTKWLCKLLRKVAKRFVIKDITVDFAERQETISEWMNGKRKQEQRKSTGALEATWKLQLGDKGVEPILVEAHTVFDFNIANKLVLVQLTSVFVNGVSLSVWPDVNTEQNLAYNLMKVQEWMQNIQLVKAETEGKLQIGDLKSTKQAEMVIETMKEEFANIFRKEPSFGVFSDDLVVVDGLQESSGLDSSRNLFNLLRKLPEEFDVRDFYVRYLESSEMHSLYIDRKLKGTSKNPHVGVAEGQDGSVLLASWKLKMGPKKSRSSPLHIEGNTVFHVHKIDGLVKVDRIVMLSTRINGKELKAWPDVDMLGDLSSSLSTIKEWVSAIEQEPESVEQEMESVDDAQKES